MARSKLKDFSAEITTMDNDQLVNRVTVCKLMNCSPATLWRMQQEGRFPNPIRLSPRRSAWHLGKVREAIQKLVAEVAA